MDSPTTNTQKIIEYLNIDISKAAALIVGFFYVSGYLIRAITLRNYGVSEVSTVTLHHIESGITFVVLTATFSVIPLGGLAIYSQVRKNTNMPNYRIGVIGSFLNLYHLFLIVMLFALFVSNAEWSSKIVIFFLPSNLSVFGLFTTYSLISCFVLIVLPIIERLIISCYSSQGTRNTKIDFIYRFFRNKFSQKFLYSRFVEPIRFSGILSGLLFDITILHIFPWLRTLLLQGIAYFTSVALLSGVTLVIFFYIKEFMDKTNFYVIFFVSLIGLIFVLYMCINAYVYAVVRYIPMNRGGSLPITQAYIVTNNQVFQDIPISRSPLKSDVTRIGPVYVLESTSEYIYVTEESDRSWFKKWGETVAIKKEDIQYIEYERIIQGGPREIKSGDVR